MEYGLHDNSAAPEGEEELVGKNENIVALVLNSDLGNVVADKDKYTEKRLIIKVSLTEVMFIRKKVSFRWNGPSHTGGAARSLRETRLGSRHGTAGASVDRIKTFIIPYRPGRLCMEAWLQVFKTER